ncbi:MAG: glycerol kinase GlpK [Chitinivibrionales bacterium]|nr:glycerol kinase GlpK [Chitinivibrionales bacterium]
MYILAIDQGTTGTTVSLVNDRGVPVARATVEIRQIFPQPGWVEHDPLNIWESVRSAVAKLVAGYPFDKRDIIAIGIVNQRETTVLWDRSTGLPLHNAIVWQDRRTQEICEELVSRGYAADVKQCTGLPLESYFSATKIKWLLDTIPGLRQKAQNGTALFGTIDAWLLWKLTNGKAHATDCTNACRTMLCNINTQAWDKTLLEIFQVPATVLPQVFPSAHIFGHTQGIDFLPDGIPIAGMAGDQQAALFGQGCVLPGQIKNTYGTGGFMLLNTGDKNINSKAGLITTLCCDARGKPVYALEGAVFIAGAAIQWLRDGLKILESAAESEAAACSVKDSGGVYFVPAFVGLGTPYWDMQARGAIFGLSRGTNRAHIIRAALESLAYQSREVLEVMQADSGLMLASLRVDGGAAANNFLMQFQADILGCDVVRPVNIETTALGAALLAGVGAGLWEGAEICKSLAVERLFKPQMEPAQAQKLYKGYQAAVARILTTKG